MSNFAYFTVLSSVQELKEGLTLFFGFHYSNSKYPLIIFVEPDGLLLEELPNFQNYIQKYNMNIEIIILEDSYKSINAPYSIGNLNILHCFTDNLGYSRMLFLDYNLTLLDNLDFLLEDESLIFAGYLYQPDWDWISTITQQTYSTTGKILSHDLYVFDINSFPTIDLEQIQEMKPVLSLILSKLYTPQLLDKNSLPILTEDFPEIFPNLMINGNEKYDNAQFFASHLIQDDTFKSDILKYCNFLKSMK